MAIPLQELARRAQQHKAPHLPGSLPSFSAVQALNTARTADRGTAPRSAAASAWQSRVGPTGTPGCLIAGILPGCLPSFVAEQALSRPSAASTCTDPRRKWNHFVARIFVPPLYRDQPHSPDASGCSDCRFRGHSRGAPGRFTMRSAASYRTQRRNTTLSMGPLRVSLCTNWLPPSW